MAQNTNNNVTPQTPAADTSHAAAIKWEQTTFDFGKIPQGKPVSINYVFTNTGNAPLVVTGVHPSCGCTTNDFSKEMVAPGKSGFVKLTFNASIPGVFTKSTRVTTNSKPDTYYLMFNGEVMANPGK